jgi:hypothetical protein
MATKKVSALTALTSPDGSEELLVNDGGTSKKVTIDNLLYDESIDSDHYVDGSIDNAHLADDAVDSDELAAGAVDIAHLSASGTAGSSNFLRGDNSWVTPTDTNTMGSGFTVSATTDSNATTITQGDDLMFTAGTGITCETTADGTVTITNTVSGASTATSSATGVIKIEDDTDQSVAAESVSTTANRTYGLQLNSSDQGVVNVPWTDTNTTYSVQDGELSQINFTSADNTKLDGIEASADVTDTTNVTAAGALMDSECSGLAAVKATTGTFLSADESKLDGIEASADVTDATNVGSVVNGKQTIYVPANAMTPTTSNGCADIAAVETTAGRPDMYVLDFDKDSDEFAQFTVAFPKSWNLGTVTYQVFWSGIASADDVDWMVDAVAMNDNETIDVAYGTPIVVTDNAQGAVKELLVSDESSAVTIAGTPADNDLTYFRIGRDVSGDAMAGDARLHGVKIFFTTDALNDD